MSSATDVMLRHAAAVICERRVTALPFFTKSDDDRYRDSSLVARRGRRASRASILTAACQSLTVAQHSDCAPTHSRSRARRKSEHRGMWGGITHVNGSAISRRFVFVEGFAAALKKERMQLDRRHPLRFDGAPGSQITNGRTGEPADIADLRQRHAGLLECSDFD